MCVWGWGVEGVAEVPGTGMVLHGTPLGRGLGAWGVGEGFAWDALGTRAGSLGGGERRCAPNDK